MTKYTISHPLYVERISTDVLSKMLVEDLSVISIYSNLFKLIPPMTLLLFQKKWKRNTSKD